ncbi:class I SAM-dependent methyltransferase [Syntrophotalea acetylenivorans]|nr:class I SAM-dependent methyltransferase [Syntrophotalea acetylenivorans]
MSSKYPTFGYRLPHLLSSRLFGDRQRFGLKANMEDACWKEWEKCYLDFYYENQKKSVGSVVNDAGYKVMEKVDLTGKKVLEIGPGDIRHMSFWCGMPAHYVIADINQAMLDKSASRLREQGVDYSTVLLSKQETARLPFEDSEFDVVVSFYSLEHLYPLEPYLTETSRVLRQGGVFAGGIPCEGGLAWGIGRFLTSRRWLKNNTRINPDKIICWEHPNFAEDILKSLDENFALKYLSYWPFGARVIDINLVAKFVYEKR